MAFNLSFPSLCIVLLFLFFFLCLVKWLHIFHLSCIALRGDGGGYVSAHFPVYTHKGDKTHFH